VCFEGQEGAAALAPALFALTGLQCLLLDKHHVTLASQGRGLHPLLESLHAAGCRVQLKQCPLLRADE
jgi:hypothetical protein